MEAEKEGDTAASVWSGRNGLKVGLKSGQIFTGTSPDFFNKFFIAVRFLFPRSLSRARRSIAFGD